MFVTLLEPEAPGNLTQDVDGFGPMACDTPGRLGRDLRTTGCTVFVNVLRRDPQVA
jgi:hypothetical protein